MDTLARKRRSAGVGDVEEASGAAERDYETALGQAELGVSSGGGVSGTLLNGVVGGEASPGTLESGEGRGQEIAHQLPSANPFHSERVKAEVELIRNRPTSLDEDARRAVREYDDSALGSPVGTFRQEPDYSALTGDCAVARDAPRVARVEPSPGDPSPATGLEDPLGAASDLGSVNVSKGPAGLGLGEQRAGISGRDTGTGEEDGRELIPAEDRFERMEALLLQVMEENRSLKRRLDQQVESRWDDGIGFHGYGKQVERCSSRGSGILGRYQARGPKAPSLPLPLPPVPIRAQSPGYPLSPGGTVIRPPPLPISMAPTTPRSFAGFETVEPIATACFGNTRAEAEASSITAEGTQDKRARAKGITEDADSKSPSAGSANATVSSASPIPSQEALVAEATKLLKGVALRAIGVGDDPDWSWIRSALASASNPEYCLIDSGATNALHPAEAEELRAGKVIRVDLASGTTELRINEFGTLLHGGQCQAYENKRAGRPLLSKAEVEEGISEVDQLVFLRAMFPQVPLKFLARACAAPLSSENVDWAELPWNRLVTSSWFLYEAIHEIRADSKTKAALEVIQAQEFGFSLAEGRYKEVLERRLILRKLTEDDSARIGVVGQSWDVEASGRDRGKGYKYFLACAYAVPEKYVPVVTADDDTAEYAPSECGELLPVSPNEADTSALDPFQGEDIFGDLGSLPEPGLYAVTHRVKGKRPESGTGELGSEVVSSSAPGVVPGGDPTSGGPVKGHRTLFFGVPLRTKRGKEVFPCIQGVINRLEAAGFPVQRFHADRAKELRTTALTSWLKHQAIHPTWTAGESPAGNRAELAVQNLKGFVRKLLYIADLSKSYWPLEFASRVVLLTNTVYPLGTGPVAVKKPKYRLVGDFVVVSKDSTEGDFVVIGDDLEGSESDINETDVYLEEEETGSGFFFEVGLAEARKELDKWKDPALEEVKSSSYEKVGHGEEKMSCGVLWQLSSYRVALIFAAGHPSWTGVTIDVKSAFLYAPIRSDSKGVEERIIVKPPSFLLELGIMTRDDRWWIRKALYGLPTSPRDWGRYRDAEFTKFCLRWGEDEYHLVQALSDDALWLARKVTKSGYGDTEGILVVYVDDLAFLAPKGLGKAFVAAVQERWKTSTPEWFSERPLTFCGMELSQHGYGYRMSQSAYVRELLGRYGIEESASTPITRWTEPEAGSQPSAEEIKEAQAMTGALLWLSTRTRPDLAYVVSRCGQQATMFLMLSEVLFRTMGCCRYLGVPVTWESSRQSFVTLSSAEAELVTMISGLQTAEAVLPLVQELVEQDVTISLLADNEAAIRQYQIADIATKPLARARFLVVGVAVVWGWWWFFGLEVLQVLSPEGCLMTVGEEPEGAQWMIAVEEYLLTGYPETDPTEAADAYILSGIRTFPFEEREEAEDAAVMMVGKPNLNRLHPGRDWRLGKLVQRWTLEEVETIVHGLQTGVAVAQESGFSEAVDLWSCPKDSCELTTLPVFSDVGDPEGEQGYGCDGSVLWEIARFVSIGLIWEASRWFWNKWFRNRKLSRDVGCQTESDGVLCLPL
ncbi:TY5A, partial [Symbiodinium necroappetens]